LTEVKVDQGQGGGSSVFEDSGKRNDREFTFMIQAFLFKPTQLGRCRPSFSSIPTRDGMYKLLQRVQQGKTSPAQALESIQALDTEEVGGYALIDHHRTLRTGFPEVVFGDGKTPQQIAAILSTLSDKAHPLIMATRVTAEAHEIVQTIFPNCVYYEEAKIVAVMHDTTCTLEDQQRGPPLPKPTRQGNIAVLAAGTCDLPVAEEAVVTASLYGHQVTRLYDVGVAGIHRLLNERSLGIMREADVLIVAAGMEGALPSVVAGLVDSPVVALPTSVGYGASFAGVTPLLTMLSSCAPGIGVVNIDNGFGAAALACAMLRIDTK
jgi:NCAIR mutase (PurE)-related protein